MKAYFPRLSTLGDYLTTAETLFTEHELYYGHGTENAWDEAVYLALYALKLSPEADRSLLNRSISEEEHVLLSTLFKRRIDERLPAAYLTGEAWFSGLPFTVTPEVLIPRSPFAELIAHTYEPWINPEKTHRILEIGTGSGCIAIATAIALPQAEIVATDISTAALNLAKHNAARHQVEKRIHFLQSDLWENIPDQRYDLIISNPPYVDAEDMANLPLEYQQEPVSALAAGQDGLAIILPLLQAAQEHLTPHGVLIVEVGNSQAALEEKYPHLPFIWLSFEHGGEGVFILTAQDFGDKPM